MSAVLAALRRALERSGQIAKASARGYNTDEIWTHATDAQADFPAFRRRLGDIGVHVGTPGQANDRLRYMRGKREAPGGERIYPVFLRRGYLLPLRHDPGAFNAENLEYALPTDLLDSIVRSEGYKRRRWSANGRLAAMRDALEARGVIGLRYRNTGEHGNIPEELRTARDERWAELLAGRQKRGLPVNVFSREDQMSPEYVAFREAEAALNQARMANEEDSVAVFRPESIKSVFAREFNPRSREMLRALPPALLGGAEALRRLLSEDREGRA